MMGPILITTMLTASVQHWNKIPTNEVPTFAYIFLSSFVDFFNKVNNIRQIYRIK